MQSPWGWIAVNSNPKKLHIVLLASGHYNTIQKKITFEKKNHPSAMSEKGFNNSPSVVTTRPLPDVGSTLPEHLNPPPPTLPSKDL